MTTATDLAREIADLKRRLAAVERSSQLGRSSIDSGTLAVNDDSGQQVLSVGKQADGTYAVVGTNGGQVRADTVSQEVLDELSSQLQLADGAVTEAKLAADAVTETKIADDAVTTPKIVAGAVQAEQIAAGAVAAGKLAADSVLADNIVANAVTADKIAANAITASKIAAGAITADKLTADAIDGKTINGASLVLDDLEGGGSVDIDGETGKITLTGTSGKKVVFVPSNINPQIEFHSQADNNMAFINQPAGNSLHASLGLNSGGYTPGDGVGRSMRLWLNSEDDRGRLEVIRKTDQIRMGGYLWVRSDQALLGLFNDVTGLDSYVALRNDGRVFIAAPSVVSSTILANNVGLAEVWQTPTLNSPWTNFGLGQQTARYRLMPDGTVLLDGDVKTTASVAAGTTIFTVPSAYRPAANHTFSITGAGVPAGATVNVLATGAVTLSNFSTTTVALLGLTGVRWPIASL